MQVDISGDRTYTVQETAEILQVTEEAVLSLVHRCELPASNINTKPDAQRPRWRILASDIGKFLLRTRHANTAPKPSRKSRKPVTKDYFA